GLDLVLDGLERRGVGASLAEAIEDDADRILLLPLLELLVGAVLTGIAHGVPTEAVGLDLDERGAAALARALDGRPEPLAHHVHVVALEAIAGHAVAGRLHAEIGERARARHRGAHRVLVVLADEHGRELPEPREAHRLVEAADVRRALSEEAERGVIRPEVFVAEGRPRRERDVAADDAPAPEEAVLHVEEVHRAAHPPRAA